jgi:DNA-binding MarR family transcriptional regulator
MHIVGHIDARTPVTSTLAIAYKALWARLTAALAPLDLHPGQDRVLLALWPAEQLPQGELGRRLGIEQPTVTKALQRLERAGFVQRERNPSDNRQVMVSLTSAGRDAYAPIRDARLELEREWAGRLSSEDQQQLISLLMRVCGETDEDPLA